MPNPLVHIDPANSCCDCNLEHPCAIQPQGISDTVRWQNTALSSWNRSTARSVQEAASRGCSILPAPVTLEPGRFHPWGEGSRCAPISHPSELRQDVSWSFTLQGRYFPEPPAVRAPGSAADGGQHTAKGCQAAPRERQGLPFNAVQTHACISSLCNARKATHISWTTAEKSPHCQ